ncbi:MAG: DUF3516 domain-containing protein [Opitutaceae bacterium]|nr:DUF3516 domain-containing protein [Opitutaceae bacterium]
MSNAPLTPLPPGSSNDDVMARFLDVMSERGMTLYPEQEEAILELFAGNNVILATPTGSGKSLVAAALHFKELCAHVPVASSASSSASAVPSAAPASASAASALALATSPAPPAKPRRSIYTCPIKALVNEKFLALCRDFGPENVGMMTGDASVNPDAPVLCCTAEILANIALAGGPRAEAVAAVIMDEFHYYSDNERGVAWQVPLLTLPRARFLLMSATLGNMEFIGRELTRLTGAPAVTVRSDRRPVPLQFEYSETPLAERVAELLSTKRAPVYLVYFTQREAAEAAQDLTSLAGICTREEKAAIAAALEGVRFNSPHGRDVKRWLRAGIGVHHAGLLPRYRILVEQLAQRGLLKLICGTDTLGVGINVPIRTVVFTKLWKYDGQKAAILNVRDFRQIAGRAGRKGFDDTGYVIVQAPDYVIANKAAAEKAAANPRAKKNVPKQKAREGTPGWDAKTFEKLMSAPPEPLQSRFAVSHGMLLHVLSRDADGCRVMRRLIDDSHEPAMRKKTHRHRAWQLFRALLDRKIIEWIPREARPGNGKKLRVNVDLQDDFSLHQPLSLYLLDTLPKLDRESPDYAFDVLTLCEAIVENPDTILRRQLDRVKDDELARMKAAGIPYDERMAKLDALEYPKPLREFLYDTFNAFAAAHPWVENENVRPKSIAREMYERYQSFSEYVREYGIERGEGLLLRHLSQVCKVLAQTVPDAAKTGDVLEMETYFRELIRGIDNSLLEEWERMSGNADSGLRNATLQAGVPASGTPADGTAADDTSKPARPANYDITRDAAGLRRLARTAILGFLQDVAARDYDAAAERMTWQGGAANPAYAGDAAAKPQTAQTDRPDRLSVPPSYIEQQFAPYFDARGRFRLDPEGRAAKHTYFDDDGVSIAQVLADADEQNDWESRFTLDREATRRESRVVLRFDGVGAIGEKPGERIG